jgi:hypothetical protein
LLVRPEAMVSCLDTGYRASAINVPDGALQQARVNHHHDTENDERSHFYGYSKPTLRDGGASDLIRLFFSIAEYSARPLSEPPLSTLTHEGVRSLTFNQGPYLKLYEV